MSKPVTTPYTNFYEPRDCADCKKRTAMPGYFICHKCGCDASRTERRIIENYNDSIEDVDAFNERIGGGVW